MGYLLLTGATGLLGRYLLWELAQQNQPVAVVVRPSRATSARQRIEDLMYFWEKKTGYHLPRPVVLEGELTQPSFGFDRDQLQWIRNHCHALVHNAASLTFIADTPEGEPYPSNIEGTKNALEVCRQAGIKTFHQVSTAYVCGDRTGTIQESELNVGQGFRNDYERSKFAGEQLVRSADFIESLTIHRPGIIIGDSLTGYTSTFHGFYVPLAAAYGLAGSLQIDESFESIELLRVFGMKGDEQKNFVPVDWVAKIMGRIICDERFHGQVYHLTPSRRTALRDMVRVILLAFGDHPPRSSKPIDLAQFESQMREQMAVYSTYWDQDPEFDRTNTVGAFPELPCPDVDEACLRRTCDFALKTKFGWPKPPSNLPEFDAASLMNPLHWKSESEPGMGISVSGPGGGEWTIGRSETDQLQCVPGISPGCAVRLMLNSNTLHKLVANNLTTEDAVRQGRLSLEYDRTTADESVLSMFEKLLRQGRLSLGMTTDQTRL
jgi:thioester reductase-like protein